MRKRRPANEIEQVKIKARPHGVVWVCIRREKKRAAYHFQGVGVETETATAEEMAVAMCVDETFFIFPSPVNVALPLGDFDPPGAYYPLAPGKKRATKRSAAKKSE